jgi:hypothetical protein
MSGLKNINFIFGANGAGKTTIGRVVTNKSAYEHANCSITWRDGVEMQPLVYNRDFVDANSAFVNVVVASQRIRVPDGSATARAIDYSLGRWGPLTRYLDDGDVPIDNNWAENRIRPIALGRNNWLFAGSLRAGRRAAAIMSLIQSARLNGHDAFAYMKDVLERLPSQPASRIDELLPHRWRPAT